MKWEEPARRTARPTRCSPWMVSGADCAHCVSLRHTKPPQDKLAVCVRAQPARPGALMKPFSSARAAARAL